MPSSPVLMLSRFNKKFKQQGLTKTVQRPPVDFSIHTDLFVVRCIRCLRLILRASTTTVTRHNKSTETNTSPCIINANYDSRSHTLTCMSTARLEVRSAPGPPGRNIAPGVPLTCACSCCPHISTPSPSMCRYTHEHICAFTS